jgi:hypothetical protein
MGAWKVFEGSLVWYGTIHYMVSQYFWNSADMAEFHVAVVYFYGAFEILPPQQNSLDDSYVKI